MDSGKKRPWSEPAIIVAVILFLATSIYYRNWTGFAVGLFSFTPIVLFYLCYPFRYFLVASLILVAVFLIFFGIDEAPFLVFTYLISSMICGELIRRERPPEQVVLGGIFPSVVSGISLWFIQAYQRHQNPVSYFRDITLQNLNETVRYYEKIGMDRETIEFLKNNLNDVARWFLNLFPGIYLAGVTMMIFLNYLLIRFLLVRLEKQEMVSQSLTLWHPPDSMVWGLIGAGFLILFPPSLLKILGGNLMMLFCLLYFFQGLALVADYYKRKNVRMFWRNLSYLMLLVWPLLGMIVAFFGLFDIWIDFRKIRKETPARV